MKWWSAFIILWLYFFGGMMAMSVLALAEYAGMGKRPKTKGERKTMNVLAFILWPFLWPLVEWTYKDRAEQKGDKDE